MKKKKTTIEDLAGLIKSSEQRLGNDIEKLAIMVVNKFNQVDEQFTEVKGELTEVKDELGGLKERVGKVETGMDKMTTRMASVEYGQYEIQKKFDGVAGSYDLAKMDSKYERRFQKIETKIGLKQKTK